MGFGGVEQVSSWVSGLEGGLLSLGVVVRDIDLGGRGLERLYGV